MLFIFRTVSYTEFDLSLISYDCQSVLLPSTALREGPAVSAQCGRVVWNPGRWQHGPFASPCVAVVAGSTAGPCPLTRCRDMGPNYALLLPELSPTILLLLGCRTTNYSLQIGAGCPLLMYRDRLALPDVHSCLVYLDVAASLSLLMMELLVLADAPSSWCRR